MKRKLVSLLASVLAIACLFSACQSGPPAVSADPAPLSAEEATKLQEELTPSNSGTMMSMAPRSIEDYFEKDWVPVYIQITGEEETFENAHEGMDFFRIPLKVLHDPSGRYQDGQEVALYRNTMFRGLLPELKEGDVLVALMKDCLDTHQDDNDILRVEISDIGCYAITEDGHAIATYKEPENFQQNGVGLATLLNEFDALEKDSANS